MIIIKKIKSISEMNKMKINSLCKNCSKFTLIIVNYIYLQVLWNFTNCTSHHLLITFYIDTAKGKLSEK